MVALKWGSNTPAMVEACILKRVLIALYYTVLFYITKYVMSRTILHEEADFLCAYCGGFDVPFVYNFLFSVAKM